ncbi:MAG: carbamoyl phosphate synthase small subunit [Candidatus Improbicoccus devescovinae]|nr:MAG: carbamoyl phosphate synthase small subunit [Candidatus Improbicoccus devescovinae]
MIFSDISQNKKLVFENGRVFMGTAFGADCPGIGRVLEVVFNTSMTGYQEIFSDASYYGQAVCLTYPLIGNYGIIPNSFESNIMHVGAIIACEFCSSPSNYACEMSLDTAMDTYDIPGIYGVDTRAVTRMLRDYGTMRAAISDINIKTEEIIEHIKNMPYVHDHVKHVSCKNIWRINSSSHKIESFDENFSINDQIFTNSQNFDDSKFNIIVIDCGIKYSIIKNFVKRNCNVIIVPYDTPAEKILSLNPDGIVISNGPGDPEDNQILVKTTKKMLGIVPIFGICMGHQILCWALGGITYKLKFGHRGGNHPVKDLKYNKIVITAQNHSYTAKFPENNFEHVKIRHVNLLDNSVEGLECEKLKLFSVQYHPEGAPGPNDSGYLFDEFIEKIKEFKK